MSAVADQIRIEVKNLQFGKTIRAIAQNSESSTLRSERPALLEAQIGAALLWILSSTEYTGDPETKVRFNAEDIVYFVRRYQPDLRYVSEHGKGALFFAAENCGKYAPAIDGRNIFDILTDYAVDTEQKDVLLSTFHDYLPLGWALGDRGYEPSEASLIRHLEVVEFHLPVQELSRKDGEDLTLWHSAVRRGYRTLAGRLERYSSLEATQMDAYVAEHLQSKRPTDLAGLMKRYKNKAQPA